MAKTKYNDPQTPHASLGHLRKRRGDVPFLVRFAKQKVIGDQRH